MTSVTTRAGLVLPAAQDQPGSGVPGSGLHEDGGFTLIELLVVIVIISILAAIAIPIFLNQREKGYDAQAKSDLREAANLEEVYFTDFSVYSPVVDSTCTSSTLKVCYTRSANVSPIVATWVTALGAGSTSASDAANGYCLYARSDSGNTFYYNSVKGGLNQPCG